MASLPPVYCCHCTACQSWTGSAFSQQIVVAESALAATGPIADYSYITPSGSTSHHRVCGDCHSRLWNTNERLPGFAIVRAGTLDASDTLTPVAHIWASRKQPWISLPEGVPTYAENAPPAEFAAIVRG